MFEMTKNVLRNLSGKYSTRLYPFTRRDPYTGYRGRLEQNIDECIFCHMCEKRCPSVCISVDNKNFTWSCDPFACVYCGFCVDVCPTHCLSMSNIHRSVTGERETMFYQGKPKPKKAKAEKAAPAAE
jgi:ech hydrogenase subunit F